MASKAFERKPRSLAATYLLIMLIGLLIIQVIFFFITINVRTEDQLYLAINDRSRVTASYHEVFKPLTPRERLDLVARLRTSSFTVHIADRVDFEPGDDRESEQFSQRISGFIRNYNYGDPDFVQPQVLTLFEGFSVNWSTFYYTSIRDRSSDIQNASPFLAKAAVSLDHGQWLIMDHTSIYRVDHNLLSPILEMLAQFLLNLALAAFVINYVTRALRQMADYADRLVPELPEQPGVPDLALPTKGPSEVLRTSRAIEAMYRRIRGFVQERFQMLASISHDLRTPIHRIRFYLEKDPGNQYQAQLMEALDDLQSMADDAVTLARAGVNHEEERLVDLSGFLGSIVEDRNEYLRMTEGASARQIDLHAPAGAACRIRPQSFRRCLDNIIDNALHYAERVWIGLEQVGDSILIRVDDNGPGIAEDGLDKIFLPFYRNEAQNDQLRAKSGNGLGLSIAQDMARLNRAVLECRNRPEGGLSVRIIIQRPVEESNKTSTSLINS